MSIIDLCDRLSAETGIDFRISDDTCDPVGYGQLGYWVTCTKGGYEMAAFTTFFHDEVFVGRFTNQDGLIAKISELEGSV